VEIHTTQVETSLAGLRPKLISIPLIKKRFTVPIKKLFSHLLERMQGGRKIPQMIQVTRTQLPIAPAFAITTYKAQGLTMNKIVVNLLVRERLAVSSAPEVESGGSKKMEPKTETEPKYFKFSKPEPEPEP
jgi:hypothetical protein